MQSKFPKLLLGAATASSILLCATIASSDDVQPRLPDVMLIVDTSGAMELSPNGKVIGDCTATGTPSRWSLVIQALTGTIPSDSISCSGGLVRSHGLRAGQNGAVTLATPGDWPTAGGAGTFDQKDAVCFLDAGSNCQKRGAGLSEWNQADDGILDAFGRKVRFGLMTSDLGRMAATDGAQQSPADSWNLDGTASRGTYGDYSYWFNTGGGGTWKTGVGYQTGKYANSPMVADEWEVGVRNRNAPPWGGRMMGFGPDALTEEDTALQNERIQRVLLSTRAARVNTVDPQVWFPFQAGYPHPGDLPAAGPMLSDALDFFDNDNDQLGGYPTSSTLQFDMSSAQDLAVTGGCRLADAIFITSGPFGGDMRKVTEDDYDLNWATPCPPSPPALPGCTPPSPDSCIFPGGVCPYDPGGTGFSASAGAALKYFQDLQTKLGPDHLHLVAPIKSKGLRVYPNLIPLGCPSPSNPDFTTFPVQCVFDCDQVTMGDFAFGGVCDFNTTYITKPYRYAKEGDLIEPDGNIAACCDIALLNSATAAPNKAIFIEDISTLKSSVANIVAKSLGGTTSRTQTAYAVAATTIDKSGKNPTSAGPGGPVVASSFELLSSLRAFYASAPGNPEFNMWRGYLERRRLACDAAIQPKPVTIVPGLADPSGDDLGANIAKYHDQRKFFTVVNYQGANTTVGRSLRNYATDQFGLGDPSSDNLDSPNVGNSSMTGLQTAANLSSKIDSMPGLGSGDLLGLKNSDQNKCTQLFTSSGWGRNQCANKVLRWFGGFWNGRLSDRCEPGVAGCAADVANVNAYPLGAIYHSTPIAVGPPSDFLNDEQYRSSFAVVAHGAPNATPDGQATRPTVEYAASIDGQLHAFVIANNSSQSPDTKYGTSAPNPPPNADGSELQELWTFIPPIALPNIFANFNSHAILLDGPLVVSDIVPRRDQNKTIINAPTAVSGGDWRTILVGSGGASALGGYYYALDVTDPRAPRFLWQLSTAGTPTGGNNSPVPLFGAAVPGAAIATVGLKNGTQVDQVAVAILPGGSPGGAAPTGVTARRCSGGCGGTGVRGTIRNWGNSVPSRSVTIVKLETGEVIKRFEGVIGSAANPGDLPSTDNLLNGRRDATNPLDSPMTSTPVAFPNTPGVAATRAYVGDADGTMWRIDLSNPDPSLWKVRIAWDSYGAYWNANSGYSGTTPQDLVGEPIATTPVVSVDTEGNPMVSFSTGAQEGFQIYADQMDTEIVAFQDIPQTSGPDALKGAISAAPQIGFQKPFFHGMRVTGPLSVFAGVLYATTFAPVSTTGPVTVPCPRGGAAVWGLDFQTGVPALDDDNNQSTAAVASVGFNDQEVLFGVQVNRVPSCYDSTLSTTSDGWIGGDYHSTTTTSASNYQLVVQTGRNTGTSGFGGTDDLTGDATGKAGAETNSFHVQLNQPKAMVTLRSWASIGE